MGFFCACNEPAPLALWPYRAAGSRFDVMESTLAGVASECGNLSGAIRRADPEIYCPVTALRTFASWPAELASDT